MDKVNELDLFIEKADELISAKYLFAEVKIAGVLKSIACSEVLLGIMQSCLKDFDYESVFETAFVKNDDDPRGEYRQPETAKDMLALVFTVLMMIDSGTIDLADFMKGYFYADGSLFNSFNEFTSKLIKPFKNTVKVIFEGIISGKIKNPKDVLPKSQVETRDLPEDLALDATAVRSVMQMIEEDKNKFISSGLSNEIIADADTLINGIAAALDSGDKKAIKVAFTGYAYFSNPYKKLYLNVEKIRVMLNKGKLI